MKAAVKWDAKTYRFGQRAKLTLTVTNDSNHPILLLHSTMNFHKTDKKLKKSHSIQIDPHESKMVWEISDVIGPWAERAGAIGTLCITYQVKKGSKWEKQKSQKFPQNNALTITDANSTGRTIFISHSNRDHDKEIVEEAERIVRKLGFEPYISEKNSQLGVNLWKKILGQIQACDGLLFILTKDGDKSCDMREELGYARMRNAICDDKAVKIVPIVEKGVDPAGSFKGEEYKEINYGEPRLAADQIVAIIIESFGKGLDQA